MRETLFRGKRVDNGEWVYGYYATQSNHACFQSELKYTSFILKDEFMDWGLGGLAEYEVIPETVGQFTGLTDKNGNKIFEGDIVKSCFRSDADKEPMTVEFRTERGGWFPFACGDGCGCCEVDTYPPEYTEVIGNIYDNKELLGNDQL